MEAFMLSKVTGVYMLMAMLIFSACTNVKETSKPNFVGVQDFTTDCSKVVIPSNIERDTNLDIEKGILTVHWYDDSKGNVGIVFGYKDQNCSESAKQLTQHVLKTEWNSADEKNVISKLKIGQTKQQVIDIFGNGNVELIYKGMEAGEPYILNAWRYDFGIRDGFIVETRTGHEGWAHTEALESGSVKMQLLIHWINEKVSNFALDYKGVDGKLHSIYSTQDGTIKELIH
jgi:hypothetical protein